MLALLKLKTLQIALQSVSCDFLDPSETEHSSGRNIYHNISVAACKSNREELFYSDIRTGALLQASKLYNMKKVFNSSIVLDDSEKVYIVSQSK